MLLLDGEALSSLAHGPAARRAGRLLGATDAGSERAVDAFMVAVADLAGGAVVATVDSDDLGRLASYASHVAIANIGD